MINHHHFPLLAYYKGYNVTLAPNVHLIVHDASVKVFLNYIARNGDKCTLSDQNNNH